MFGIGNQKKWCSGSFGIALGLLLTSGCSAPQKQADPVVVTTQTTAVQPVTADNGKPVEVDLKLEGNSKTKGIIQLNPGDSLKGGDGLAMSVKVNQPAYVYIAVASSDGSTQMLFPKSGDQLVPASEELRIPSNPAKYIPLDNKVGTENIFVYAAKRPIASAELVNLVSADAATVKAAAAKRTVTTKKPKPASPVSKAPSASAGDVPDVQTPEDRGLKIEEEEPGALPAVASSESNGVVRKRFSVRHQ